MSAERGSILPMFAGLVFTSFVMLALVVELALLATDYRVVAGAADAAAESGASMLSVVDAYASELALDPAAWARHRAWDDCQRLRERSCCWPRHGPGEP